MQETQYLDARELQGIVKQASQATLIGGLALLKLESSTVHLRGAVVAYGGRIQVEGQWVTIHVGFKDTFPLSLPLIHVVLSDAFGFIPHVDRDGSVCYVQSEGLLLDSHNPAGILEEAIQRAIFTLSQGVNRENLYDFVDEFETYWWVLSPSRSALSFVSPSEELREVVVVRSQTEREHYLFIADSVEVVSAYLNHGRVQQGTLFNAIYVPLQDGTLLIPPEPGAFWDLQEIQTIVQQNGMCQ
jgi:molybdopterin-synthase adenylyltransferase